MMDVDSHQLYFTKNKGLYGKGSVAFHFEYEKVKIKM